jgi:hypothetical protein
MIIDLTRWGESPDQKVWVILDPKSGTPLGCAIDRRRPPSGDNLQLLAWLEREVALGYQRQDRQARRGKLVPWTVRRIIDWCAENRVREIAPDIASTRIVAGQVLPGIVVASLEVVLANRAAPNN